jgi:hypothetical protein
LIFCITGERVIPLLEALVVMRMRLTVWSRTGCPFWASTKAKTPIGCGTSFKVSETFNNTGTEVTGMFVHSALIDGCENLINSDWHYGLIAVQFDICASSIEVGTLKSVDNIG